MSANDPRTSVPDNMRETRIDPLVSGVGGRLIQVALVGYGYWGPNLARCIAANRSARLAAICELSPARAEAARAAHPHVPVVSEIETVLRDPDIRAVVLATLTDTHGQLALRALAHGKHVMVEKPLAGSSADAVALSDASAHRSLVLMVDHTYVFSPAFETILRLIPDRRLGPVRYYQSTRANCFGPPNEISALWDLAVHDLSMLDTLMLSTPSVVQAVGLSGASGRSTSHAQLTLTYPEGAMATALVSWIAPNKLRTVMIGFDHHTIIWDDLVAGSSVQLFDRGLEPVPDPSNRRQPHTIAENIPVPPAESLANAVGHFLDCIAHDISPRSDFAAGMRTIRLLEAADRSLANGGSPAQVEIAVGAW